MGHALLAPCYEIQRLDSGGSVFRRALHSCLIGWMVEMRKIPILTRMVGFLLFQILLKDNIILCPLRLGLINVE